MGGFYGREHELDTLVKAYQIAEQGNPQLVIIKGDTGQGKTRLVQELYEYLAEMDKDSNYWPLALNEKSNSMVLYPEFNEINYNNFKNIKWLWLAMRCENKEERNTIQYQSSALEVMRHQISIHMYPLIKKKEKYEKNKNALRAVVSILAAFSFPGGNVAVKLAEDIINHVDSSMGMIDNIKNLIDKSKDFFNKDKHNPEKIIGQEYQSLVDQTYKAISSIVSDINNNKGNTPVILIVDDSQWVDPYTLELMKLLFITSVKEQWPIMFLCTIWESSYKEQSLNLEQRTIPGLVQDLKGEVEDFDQYFLNIELPILQRDLCAQILMEELPGIGDKLCTKILTNCSGDLEMLWDTISYIKNIPGIFLDGKVTIEEDVHLPNTSKRELIKKRIMNLGTEFVILLACGSAQGIVFSKKFLEKCTKQLALQGWEEEYNQLDQKYNIIREFMDSGHNEMSEYRRQIYYEISAEMLRLSPYNREIKKVVLEHYTQLISDEEAFHKISHQLKGNMLRLIIDLYLELKKEGDYLLELAKMKLCKQYLLDGFFEECIKLARTVNEEELEDEAYNSLLMTGIEAAIAGGYIEDEKYFLDIMKNVCFDKKVYLYYLTKYDTRTNAKNAVYHADELIKLLDGNTANENYMYYLQCVTAYFYSGRCKEALQRIQYIEEHYASFLEMDYKSKIHYYHTTGLVYHNIDRNREIIEKGQIAVEGYRNSGDIYNYLLECVNVADARMAIGDLLTAEMELKHTYQKAKSSCWKHAYNIAAICYANVLACLGNTSVALSYYTEGIKVSEEIGHHWDTLYGKIWRSLALADFHDPYAITLIKQYKEEAEQNGYDYLYELSCSFYLLEAYLLGLKLENEEIMNHLNSIRKETAPGLRLEAICATLALLSNDIANRSLVSEIYELLPLCEGAKGRSNIIKKVFTSHKEWFYDQKKNTLIEDWIKEYIEPYEVANRYVEEELFQGLAEEPYLRSCNMETCKGFCCYDGVYLLEGEEDKIKQYIKNHRDEFPLRIKDYFMDGAWRGVVQGRKTSVIDCNHMEENYPKHFEQTRCIFLNDDSLCKLQLSSTRDGRHPWEIKPKACWLFPLDIEKGIIIPPPQKGEEDPMYCDESYPGYVTYLHCGRAEDEGTSWRNNNKQEMLYYYHLRQLRDK